MSPPLRDVLRSADPARRAPRWTDDELAEAARAVVSRVTAEPTTGHEDTHQREDTTLTWIAPRHPRRRRALLVAAAAALLATGLTVAPPGGAPAPGAQAATLLRHAADAIRVDDAAARPDQWWRVTRTGDDLVMSVRSGDDGANVVSAVLVRQERVDYVAVDGTRPTVSHTEPGVVVRRLSGPPEAAPPPVGERTWTEPAPADEPGSWSSPNARFLAGLPRDPVGLLLRLESDSAGQGKSVHGEVFVTVADALRSGLVPADLRAALFRVLADLPGVVVAADADAGLGGRVGTSFAYTENDGMRQEIVVDVATGDLLGERSVAITGGDAVPAGTVVEAVSVTRELVDSVPADLTGQG